MKREAEANEEEDLKMKEEIEKLNAADALIFSTEKQLKEYGDKLSDGNKTAIEGGLEKLKKAHADKNFADIESASTELKNAWNAASEEMYKETQGQPEGQADAGGNPTGGNEGGSDDDDVTDVEYEEVK